MARLVDLGRPGPVLELGAGTGSLTRGLLRAGCPPERLIAIECEPRLGETLRRGCPGIATIIGDATALEDLLAERGIERLCAVVSSLPIKWFSVAEQRAVVAPCLARLGSGGRFLQMTNAFSSPLATRRLGIGCKAEYLIDFLRYNDAGTVYLVGDIVDGWRLKKSWYWPQTHNDVVQKMLR